MVQVPCIGLYKPCTNLPFGVCVMYFYPQVPPQEVFWVCFGGPSTFSAGVWMSTWRIIPLSKWLVTPIYKQFRPFGRGTTLLRGLTNHGYQALTNWDDPPSRVSQWKKTTRKMNGSVPKPE